MRRIDELFLKYPFYGARRMALHLRREGVWIGRRRAARLMSLMGLQAIYRAPRTSDLHPEHRVYPYLLRGLAIERANHVWCADITYIPVQRGFLYLVAIMDWASRYVLAWRLSNTLDASFCTDALDEALARHGKPETVNTDQGSQFTSFAFTGRLQAPGIRVSMDGRGRCMDNIFIERLWRSLKYEAIYLHEIADGLTARRLIGEWLRFYNVERPLLFRTLFDGGFSRLFRAVDAQISHIILALPDRGTAFDGAFPARLMKARGDRFAKLVGM